MRKQKPHETRTTHPHRDTPSCVTREFIHLTHVKVYLQLTTERGWIHTIL